MASLSVLRGKHRKRGCRLWDCGSARSRTRWAMHLGSTLPGLSEATAPSLSHYSAIHIRPPSMSVLRDDPILGLCNVHDGLAFLGADVLHCSMKPCKQFLILCCYQWFCNKGLNPHNRLGHLIFFSIDLFKWDSKGNRYQSFDDLMIPSEKSLCAKSFCIATASAWGLASAMSLKQLLFERHRTNYRLYFLAPAQDYTVWI